MLNLSRCYWFLVLQWSYPFWQAVRNTRAFNRFYYTFQWVLEQILNRFNPLRVKKKTKKIVWVNPTHCGADYRWWHPWESFQDVILSKGKLNGIKFLDYKYFWYKISYKGKYYWVHQDIFFELYYYNLDECCFVKDMYDVDRNCSVAQRITEEEAMLMMFNKGMHLYEVKAKGEEDTMLLKNGQEPPRGRTVIHGREFNVEYNSKLAGFLATIPIILQVWQLYELSVLVSLVMFSGDLFRTPIYKAYDWCLFHITRFVKLRLFGRTSWMYTLFGALFGSRWMYSDFHKGFSYLTEEGDEIGVTSYVTSLHADDCELVKLKDYVVKTPDMQHFSIRDGVVSSADFNYGQYAAVFKVKKGMYVS